MTIFTISYQECYPPCLYPLNAVKRIIIADFYGAVKIEVLISISDLELLMADPEKFESQSVFWAYFFFT